MQTYYQLRTSRVDVVGGGGGEKGYWNLMSLFVFVVVVVVVVCLFGWLVLCLVFFPFFGHTVKVVPRLRDSYCRFLCLFGLSGICDTRGACMDR